MTAWYFLFEGKFREGDPTYGCKGVCSSSMVPVPDRQNAYELFIKALNDLGIDLVAIEEEFEVDVAELDKNAPENSQWVEWHDQAIESGNVLFDPWQVFETDS